MQRLLVSYFILLNGVIGHQSLIEIDSSNKPTLSSNTTPGKVSNILRDILNQESLVRFSMVQQIQSLMMDAIGNKNKSRVLERTLLDIAGQLQAIEEKDRKLENENDKLRQALQKVNDTFSYDRKLTEEKIQSLNETEIVGLRQQIASLQKANEARSTENAEIKEHLLALNSTYSKLSRENDAFRHQLRQMNNTLNKKGAQKEFNSRLQMMDDKLQNFSFSVNKTIEYIRAQHISSKEQLLKISSKLSSEYDNTPNRSCMEILRDYPTAIDGVYQIFLNLEMKSVYCDMSTDGGGWTVIQRRQVFNVDFYRNWTEYKRGFGDPSKDYWIGNDAINAMTRMKDQELRMVLEQYGGNEVYAQYSTFHLGDEGREYNLTVSGFSGTADDSLSSHNGMKFSTYDNDNDKNCARLFLGGWWYSDCGDSNLNGRHSTLFGFLKSIPSAWKGVDYLEEIVMMIRPKSS